MDSTKTQPADGAAAGPPAGDGIAKHLRLRWSLEQAIRRGDYAVGDRLPSHRELMRRYECSTATVAAALGHMVEEGLIERRPRSGTLVRAVPPPHRYPAEHNPAETTIGFFHHGFPPGFHPFFSGVVEGLTKAVDAAGFSLKVSTVRPRRLVLDPAFRDRYGMAGFVASTGRASEMWATVELNIPAVFMVEDYPDIPVERVLTDYRGAARLAFAHLRDLGHERLAVCSAFTHRNYRDVAADVFDCAVEEAPLAYYFSDRLDPAEVRHTMARWQAETERATAMLVFDDVLLKRVWRDLEAQGVRIPEDLALVGVGSPLSARFIERPATFVESDPVVWGQRAIARVMEQLEGKRDPGHREYVPQQLVIRKSCGGTPVT